MVFDIHYASAIEYHLRNPHFGKLVGVTELLNCHIEAYMKLGKTIK